MKYLSDYVDELTKGLLEKHGAFFAFSTEQFNEQKKEDVTYVRIENGLLCPKENSKQFVKELLKSIDQAILMDLKENGKDKIIRRELANYECYYTGDITEAVKALSCYENITEDEVVAIYKEECKNLAN